jgi:hypothetical protein
MLKTQAEKTVTTTNQEMPTHLRWKHTSPEPGNSVLVPQQMTGNAALRCLQNSEIWYLHIFSNMTKNICVSQKTVPSRQGTYSGGRKEVAKLFHALDLVSK